MKRERERDMMMMKRQRSEKSIDEVMQTLVTLNEADQVDKD